MKPAFPLPYSHCSEYGMRAYQCLQTEFDVEIEIQIQLRLWQVDSVKQTLTGLILNSLHSLKRCDDDQCYRCSGVHPCAHACTYATTQPTPRGVGGSSIPQGKLGQQPPCSLIGVAPTPAAAGGGTLLRSLDRPNILHMVFVHAHAASRISAAVHLPTSIPAQRCRRLQTSKRSTLLSAEPVIHPCDPAVVRPQVGYLYVRRRATGFNHHLLGTGTSLALLVVTATRSIWGTHAVKVLEFIPSVSRPATYFSRHLSGSVLQVAEQAKTVIHVHCQVP
nr:hypothetical protein CFP56_16845 [Quercus suber]